MHPLCLISLNAFQLFPTSPTLVREIFSAVLLNASSRFSHLLNPLQSACQSQYYTEATLAKLPAIFTLLNPIAILCLHGTYPISRGHTPVNSLPTCYQSIIRIVVAIIQVCALERTHTHFSRVYVYLEFYNPVLLILNHSGDNDRSISVCLFIVNTELLS